MSYIKNLLQVIYTPSKFLILCIGLGILLAIGTQLNIAMSEYKLNEIASRCLSEKNIYDAKRALIENDERKGVMKPWDEAWLTSTDSLGFNCTQSSEILSANRNVQTGKEYKFLLDCIAVLLCFLGTLPKLWYFFLRRLSEVAAAIRSK